MQPRSSCSELLLLLFSVKLYNIFGEFSSNVYQYTVIYYVYTIIYYVCSITSTEIKLKINK